MPKKRLKLSLKREPALILSRVAIPEAKLVYILITNKKLKYPYGKSSIAYVGTTKKGLARIAHSSVRRAEKILSIHGVKSVSARILTCKGRQKVNTWLKLERAFLLTFRSTYGVVPLCNSHGKKMQERDEFTYFARSAVQGLVENLS